MASNLLLLQANKGSQSPGKILKICQNLALLRGKYAGSVGMNVNELKCAKKLHRISLHVLGRQLQLQNKQFFALYYAQTQLCV